MNKTDLRLDWASHKAAKYACERWHYSRCLPTGKLIKVGVWEAGEFIGCVIFGRGANNNLGKSYALEQTQICELVRIAINKHQSPISRIVSIALQFLRIHNPGMRLCASYADPVQNHHGGIYQAGNWIFVGQQSGQTEYYFNGQQTHGRSVMAQRGTIVGLHKIPIPGKFKYLMPLDAGMRNKILPLSKTYPKRIKHAMAETIGTAAGKHRPMRSTKVA